MTQTVWPYLFYEDADAAGADPQGHRWSFATPTASPAA